MSLTYTIKDQKGRYFVTCTVNEWVDFFTRNVYKDILIQSLKYCQKHSPFHRQSKTLIFFNNLLRRSDFGH